jgi:hypothetical protein
MAALLRKFVTPKKQVLLKRKYFFLFGMVGEKVKKCRASEKNKYK